MLRTFFLGCVAWCAFMSASAAETFYVGHLDDPFQDIQSAVDFAAPGDQILVRPVRTYPPFVLDAKGLTIRGTDGPFDVWSYSPVLVVGLPADQAVRMADLRIRGCPNSTTVCAGLVVVRCAGEVVLENVSFGPAARCDILEAASVHITGLSALETNNIVSPLSSEFADGKLVIRDSFVMMQDVEVEGFSPYSVYTADGLAGMGVFSSRVLLADPWIRGGVGEDVTDGSCCHSACAGRGGAGLIVEDSLVQITGPNDGTAIIRGGDGGRVIWWDCGGRGLGGSGAVATSSARIEFNYASLEGGSADGAPSEGPVVASDPETPWLTMSTPFAIGKTVTIRLDGPADSRVWLLVAPARGFLERPVWGPMPILVDVTSPMFRIWDLGSIPSSGRLTLDVPIPPFSGGVGLAWTLQAFTLRADGRAVVSSAHTRILREE